MKQNIYLSEKTRHQTLVFELKKRSIMILNLFLYSDRFEPDDSYKLDSYKKENVYELKVNRGIDESPKFNYSTSNNNCGECTLPEVWTRICSRFLLL